jgi:hypothetical protein
MATTYRSKIDRSLGVILISSAAISLAAASLVLMQEMPGAALAAIVISAIGTALPIWLLADTQYVIDASTLVIRSGPFRSRIPLKEIRSITPTRSPISSPALSLDRLRIDYGIGRSCMVSPKDRQGFTASLQARAGDAFPPTAAPC